MYADGKGVPQDHREAAKWYRKAAEQGHAGAQADLGRMYGIGMGVPQDYVQAYAWSNIAAVSGLEFAVKIRTVSIKLMSPSQLEEAQKLSKELWEEYGKK